MLNFEISAISISSNYKLEITDTVLAKVKPMNGTPDRSTW